MPAIALNTANNSRIGSCPHGLPQGACPICSGMGSGGAKRADFSAKAGEMSWNECAAIGAFLKAQKNAQMQRNADIQNFAQAMKNFQNSLMNFSQRLANISGFLAQNTPAIIAKPVGFVLNTLIAKPIRILADLPTTIARFTQNIGQKFADISDKLAAVMGELKNSIEKKISESFSNLKKKIKSLFSIFEPLDADNDDKKIDETKKAFELRTFIHNLYKKITNNDKDTQSDDD